MVAPIAENRRARFEYHIEETYEAGVVLEGWEVKAIRAGQVQLTDGYVKADIALAKGKAEHDKRNTVKERDWEREKGRLMRHKVSGPGKD